MGSLNVNNLSPYAQGLGPKTYCTEGKGEHVCQAVCNLHIDVLLLQETDINWHKVGSEHQWKSQAQPFLDPNNTQSYMSCNSCSIKSSPLQAGGMGIMTYGLLAHATVGAG